MHTSGKFNNQKKSHNRAIDLTEHWLRVAIKIIDRNAGEGYAKAHPELISAFMTTAAANFATLTEREIAEAEQERWNHDSTDSRLRAAGG